MKMFEDMKGEEHGFYGVDNYMFKLGRWVFEAIEDEEDGYRSHLESIAHVGLPDMAIFRDRSVATVRIEEFDETTCEGYKLVDVKDGHVWLVVGTENTDDYYPYFVFHYEPKEPSPEKSS